MPELMDVATGRPARPLAGLVERYVGYRLDGFGPGVHRGLPSRHLTFIVSLDEPVEMLELPDPGQGPTSMQAFVGGLTTRPALIRHSGRTWGIAVELEPLGARALFGLPAGELGAEVVDLADLLGPSGGELVERLVETDGWPARFAVLDEVLTRALTERRSPAAVDHAWRRLTAGGGAAAPDVASLAGEIGWSRRHLTETFHREVGLPPRQLARVVRFERSTRLLPTAGPGNLAHVAAACGFYDQAHMNREWRELAGCSPTAWLAEEEFPSVQDAAGPSGSD